MAKSPFQILLSGEERAELERRVACYTLPHKVVQRAKMILYAADGQSNAHHAWPALQDERNRGADGAPNHPAGNEQVKVTPSAGQAEPLEAKVKDAAEQEKVDKKADEAGGDQRVESFVVRAVWRGVEAKRVEEGHDMPCRCKRRAPPCGSFVSRCAVHTPL